MKGLKHIILAIILCFACVFCACETPSPSIPIPPSQGNEQEAGEESESSGESETGNSSNEGGGQGSGNQGSNPDNSGQMDNYTPNF